MRISLNDAKDVLCYSIRIYPLSNCVRNVTIVINHPNPMRIYNVITGMLDMTEVIIEQLNRFKKWWNSQMREQTLIEWSGLSNHHTYLAKLYAFNKQQRYYYPRYNRRASNDGELKVPLELMMLMFVEMISI